MIHARGFFPIKRQINPITYTETYSFKTHSNILLLSKSRSFTCTFTCLNFQTILPSPILATCSNSLKSSRFNYPDYIRWSSIIFLYYCSGVFFIFSPVDHGAIRCCQRSFKLTWRCHQLLSGFLVNGHLLRVPCQSGLLANDKDVNEMIPGAVYTSPGIYIAAEESLGKY